MLSACIILAFIAAVFPVSNALLSKCDHTCRDLRNDEWDFFTECSIKTPQTSSCTLDVSEMFPFHCTNTHHVKLVCDNTQYRPIITNEQNIYCHYILNGSLHVKQCGLLWQDMDMYGKIVLINQLYLVDYEDRWDEEIVKTDYWKNHWYTYFRIGSESGNDSQEEPDIFPRGLQFLHTLQIFNMDHIPGILQRCIWTSIHHLVFTNSQLSSSRLPAELSKNLPSLENVDLSDNSLTDIPAGLFKSLSSLENVDLSDNSLTDIPAGLFKNLPFLENVDLSDNSLTDIPAGLFKNLPFLENVDLSDNSLTDIPAELSKNLPSLKNVDLSDNSLTDIPAGLFKNLPFLENVDLSDNSLTDIPAGLFKNLSSLKNVDLSTNLLTTIHRGMFVNLPVLKIINLSANQLNYIAEDAISSSLDAVTHIDLSQNKLTTIPASIFSLHNIQDIDLRGTYITFYSIKKSLQKIPPSNISFILSETVQFEVLSYIHLSFPTNNISAIDFEYLNFYPIPVISLFLRYFIVLLDNLVCDCEILSFYNCMDGKVKLTTQKEAHDFYKYTLKCDKPDHLHEKQLRDLHPLDFVCVEDIPFCPKNCTCFRRSMDKAVIVSCKQVQMTALPTQLPQGSIELDLSYNLITKFDSIFPYLAKLEKLNLQNNIINSISADVLDLLDRSHLRKLQLDTNRLCDLPQKANVFIGTNLSYLTLGNNPWECNCHTSWMKDWLNVRRHIIQDLEEVTCGTGNPAGQVYVEVKEDQFICTTPAAVVVRNALLSAGVVLVLCVIAATLVYVYRGEIKVLLYVHFNWHPFDAAENADILDMTYDAFISYSGLDYKWVCFNLLPQLENHNPPYRVCVHDRDFMPGAYIEDNIMEAVQSSRRMIMVLSQNYLKSEWCMLEFRAAHIKVLNDRTNYLILVLYDDVNVSELDEDMQLYIRTNTYLARYNQWFYNKLLYAMPTKNLQQLREEMEAKLGKTPSNDSPDHTNSGEQECSSIQFSSDTDTLITTVV